MEQGMTFAHHLWQLVSIIENYAVKEHYTEEVQKYIMNKTGGEEHEHDNNE